MREKNKKKPLFKRWWVWAIIIFIGIGALGSNGDDKEDTKLEPSKVVDSQDNEEKQVLEQEGEEISYNIGDSFVSGDLGVIVETVEEKKEFKSDNQFIENVTTEGKFVSVTAKLTNNDTKARTFSSTQFKIIDDQNREFESLTSADLMLILGDKYLFLESCNPGMSRTGIFVFEVPGDVETYSLKVYSGTGFAAKTSETVKLK